MTAKEKAIEIYEKYYYRIRWQDQSEGIIHDEAKYMALIAVDLMIEDTPEYISTFNFRLKWLKEVKRELEKL